MNTGGNPARPGLRELLRQHATATLLVLSTVLSLLRLNGREFEALLPLYPQWLHEPWRLVSATWLHVNLVHLFFNVWWLAVLGVHVERVLGTVRTAGLYLLLALVSSAAEAAIFDGGIGLSGIVYGLFGFLWTVQRADARYRGLVDKRTSEVFVLWFFICIGATLLGTMRVANVAHGVGALAGGMVGWAAARQDGRLVRSLPLAGLLLSVLLACTVLRPYVQSRSSLALERAELGFAALEEKDFERARELFEQALQADPEECRNRWCLGMALWSLARHDEALAAFERSAARCPPEPESLLFLNQYRTYLAEQAHLAGRTEEARQLVRRTLESDPYSPEALELQSQLREEAGAKR